MTLPVPPETVQFGLRVRIAAWAVHAFTLSGLLWATLAVLALHDGHLHYMWLWLGIALIVDGVDGSLARKFRVSEVIPWFDGAVVDYVVDYLTWTAIPAFFIALYLPVGPRPLAVFLVVLILVSSCFCYANTAEKSFDHYFVGFPAAWNVVAVLLWVWEAPMAVCIATIVVFSVLTVVPLHYTHPFRVERGRTTNIILTFVWIITTGLLIACLPNPPAWIGETGEIWLVVTNVIAGAALLLPGIRRTLTGK